MEFLLQPLRPEWPCDLPMRNGHCIGAHMTSHRAQFDFITGESTNGSESLEGCEPCILVSHSVRFEPITGAPTNGSEPLGDWVPCTMGEIYGLQCDVPISVVWEPGMLGRFRSDKALERCTGSWPNTYHVRLRADNGSGDL